MLANFPDDILKHIFDHENILSLITISPNFVHKGSINDT